MTDETISTWPTGDTWTDRMGVVFTRSPWGTWYGTDGSDVDDDYISSRRMLSY